MAILTIEEVRTAFKLPDHSDVDDAIAVALISARTYLEGVFRSPFEHDPEFGAPPGFRLDFFRPDAIKFPIVINNYFRLHLRQAFVWSDVVPVVSVSDELQGTYETIPTTDWWLDPQQGILYLRYQDPREDQELTPRRRLVADLSSFTSYDKMFVKVLYKAGISDDVALHEAPEWLKQAFLVYMAPTLSLTNVEETKTTDPKQVQDNVKLAATMLEPHMRGSSQAVYPLLSQ